jgi:mersacidin/lichenicidin family type 2 lantibiotic
MDIVRAWTDEEYYLGLSEEQRALLPENPAGLMELSDDDLQSIVGGSLCNKTVCNNRSICHEHSFCLIGTSK